MRAILLQTLLYFAVDLSVAHWLGDYMTTLGLEPERVVLGLISACVASNLIITVVFSKLSRRHPRPPQGE